MFDHFVGAECHEYWTTVFKFKECCEIEGFDISRRAIIFDQWTYPLMMLSRMQSYF